MSPGWKTYLLSLRKRHRFAIIACGALFFGLFLISGERSLLLTPDVVSSSVSVDLEELEHYSAAFEIPSKRLHHFTEFTQDQKQFLSLASYDEKEAADILVESDDDIRLRRSFDFLSKVPEAQRIPLVFETEPIMDVFEYRYLMFDGGNTVIGRANRRSDGLPVVLKWTEKVGHLTGDAIFLDGFSNPNIPDYYGTWVTNQGTNDSVHLEAIGALEYFNGGSIDRLIRDGRSRRWIMEEKHIAYAAKEVLQAMQYLRSKNLIHLNIKSQNIFVKKTGEVKLGDYGTCFYQGTIPPSNRGNHKFQSPEVCSGTNDLTPETDVWSFGMTIREWMEGWPCWYRQKGARACLEKTGLEPLTDPKSWSKDMLDFIGKSLRYEAKERYTVDELLNHNFLKKACSKEEWATIVSKYITKYPIEVPTEQLSVFRPLATN